MEHHLSVDLGLACLVNFHGSDCWQDVTLGVEEVAQEPRLQAESNAQVFDTDQGGDLTRNRAKTQGEVAVENRKKERKVYAAQNMRTKSRINSKR